MRFLDSPSLAIPILITNDCILASTDRFRTTVKGTNIESVINKRYISMRIRNKVIGNVPQT